MITTTCHDCQATMPRHEAHLRSVSLKQVAFCGGCLNLRAAVDAVFDNAAPELVALSAIVAARSAA
jgi:hypothetical protein